MFDPGSCRSAKTKALCYWAFSASAKAERGPD
jgi:hypothetical protein